MLYKTRLLVSFLIFILCNGCFAFEGRRTFLLPRSQSVDAARELMGWQKEINRFEDGFYWTVALTPEYQHSFDTCAITDYLLGRSQFIFSGSQVPNRRTTDIFADYFGLPGDFESIVCFNPCITNFIFDVDFYFGFACGWYFRLHAPMVHAKADLRLSETIINRGTAFYPAGYMAADRVLADDLAHSVEIALEGSKLNGTTETDLIFGDMHQPLRYGKIFGREARTHLSDLQLVLGWNFFQDDWYHFGLNARASAPTGNNDCAEFLLPALIGNGKYWELGIGLTSHVDVWESACWSCSLYCDANITHLFSTQQLRSYDLKDNPGSRYMLLQQIVAPSTNLFLGIDGPAAPNQYIGHLVPAINITTLCSTISIPVQADIVFKCAFYRGGFEFDFGYNLWIRSAEKLSCRQKLPSSFALKGDAQIYGFTVDQEAVALAATEHEATIHGGQGVTNFVVGREYANDNVDSPILAGSPGPLTQLNNEDSADLGIPQEFVFTSNPAILLRDRDINDCSALAPRAVTNKLFAHVGYRWNECECVVPFLGVGVMAEWAGRCKKDRFALSQWAFLVKGGFSY